MALQNQAKSHPAFGITCFLLSNLIQHTRSPFSLCENEQSPLITCHCVRGSRFLFAENGTLIRSLLNFPLANGCLLYLQMINFPTASHCWNWISAPKGVGQSAVVRYQKFPQLKMHKCGMCVFSLTSGRAPNALLPQWTVANNRF